MSEASALGGAAGGEGTKAPDSGAGSQGAPAQGSGSGGSSTGAGTGSWRDALPEDIRSNAAISSFTDIAALAKSHIHAQSQIGKKGAIVPGEKASDEEWGAFYRSIGVPEADKYEVAAPKDMAIAPDVLKGFKEVMSKNGVLPKAANETLNFYATFQKQQAIAEQALKGIETAKALGELKKEWGDAYERNLTSINMLVKEKGGDDVLKLLQSTTPIVPGNNPLILKLLANAAKLMGEDKLREGGASTDQVEPGELDNQINEVRAQLFALDKNDPRRATVLAKFTSLSKQKTGGK